LFQSHNGAIAAPHNRNRKTATAVSIPQWCDCCTATATTTKTETKSFNPTMVRLLHNDLNVALAGPLLFQSHNGAIAAAVKNANDLYTILVSIPQWCDCCVLHRVKWVVRLISFNPTMVRLLREIRCASRWNKGSFQSHNGAIAAASDKFAVYCVAHVSIPQWCDCCLSTPDMSQIDTPVSIPQWCDCCACCCSLDDIYIISFNPTMVRLLPARTSIIVHLTFVFQSHNGAIAAQ